MRIEPRLDRTQLLAAVSREYGLDATDLEFVPEGFEAACYVVAVHGGAAAFMKFWPNLVPTSEAAVRKQGALVLVRAMRDRGLFERVAYPLPTRAGELWTGACGGLFALFPYLSGKSPPQHGIPRELRPEFGQVVAAIHASTSALSDVLPPRETFDLWFEKDLLGWLDAMDARPERSRPGLIALREMLRVRRNDIHRQLARARELSVIVRELPTQFVLCHADLGGYNMLVDTEGRLSVLDWDWAVVAPPEHDLWTAIGDGFQEVLEAYWEAGGVRSLHLEHFAFFLARRYLGDMAARVARMLDPGNGGQEDENLLYGIETYGFARWDNLDETLSIVDGALNVRR